MAIYDSPNQGILYSSGSISSSYDVINRTLRNYDSLNTNQIVQEQIKNKVAIHNTNEGTSITYIDSTQRKKVTDKNITLNEGGKKVKLLNKLINSRKKLAICVTIIALLALIFVVVIVLAILGTTSISPVLLDLLKSLLDIRLK